MPAGQQGGLQQAARARKRGRCRVRANRGKDEAIHNDHPGGRSGAMTRHSDRARARLAWPALLAGGLLSACLAGPDGARVQTTSAGSGLAQIQTPDGQPPQEVTIPPNVMTIPGLPVPAGAEVVLGDTVLVGQDDTWTGQVVMLSGDYEPVQITEFMRRAMPRYGWEETAIVRSRRTSITFVQDDRFATVRIMPRDRGTEMDIVVAPAAAPS